MGFIYFSQISKSYSFTNFSIGQHEDENLFILKDVTMIFIRQLIKFYPQSKRETTNYSNDCITIISRVLK